MKSTREMAPAQVREAAHAAIIRELGVSGLIRYLKDQSMGSGDYTQDRHEWLAVHESANDYFADVEAEVAAMKQRGELR